MTHLLKLNGYYYYNRRPPEAVRELDPRSIIRVSLKTGCKAEAKRKALIFDDQIQSYWNDLLAKNRPHENARFRKLMRTARQHGFTYQPIATVASLPLEELIRRIMAVDISNKAQVEAVLGTGEAPSLKLSQVLDKFWQISEAKVFNKTPDQLRKWKNPRKRAVGNFIKQIGNKFLKDITRDDVLAFQSHWLKRITTEKLSVNAANKDFIHLKNVVKAVVDHERVAININELFKAILLDERYAGKRNPFTKEQATQIAVAALQSGLNNDAKYCLMALAETGARPKELVGLEPEDIVLDNPVPYIKIVDRVHRPLKNKHSAREIPLVGFALQAFQAMPNGFARYRDKPDNLTNMLNKFLRANKFLPSGGHSVYSLRHGFQDRLTGVNAPERIQCDLMGHKFHRVKYGEGGTLESKRDWLLKIALLEKAS